MVFANDFSELQSMIMAKAKKAMDETVAPIIEKKLAANAENVPRTEYSRSHNGIADRSNITHEVDSTLRDVTLIVKDTATPDESVFGTSLHVTQDDTMFSRWINNGEWMDLKAYLDSGGADKVKRESRPFVDDTQEEINLNSSAILDALKSAFC